MRHANTLKSSAITLYISNPVDSRGYFCKTLANKLNQTLYCDCQSSDAVFAATTHTSKLQYHALYGDFQSAHAVIAAATAPAAKCP